MRLFVNPASSSSLRRTLPGVVVASVVPNIIVSKPDAPPAEATTTIFPNVGIAIRSLWERHQVDLAVTQVIKWPDNATGPIVHPYYSYCIVSDKRRRFVFFDENSHRSLFVEWDPETDNLVHFGVAPATGLAEEFVLERDGNWKRTEFVWRQSS